MKNKEKIVTLFVALLMVAAAAITVNKALFGQNFSERGASEFSQLVSDSISNAADGVTVIHTARLSGTVSGYAGPVPLDIYISEGKIKDIKVLPNSETPSFFERASGIINSWIGKTPEEALEMKVDAVSGATFSSNAIIHNVKSGLAVYQGSSEKESSRVPLKIWVAFAVTLMACIVPLFVKNKVYRNIQLLANIIVLGFWCGQFLDYALVLKYLSGGFTWPTVLVAGLMVLAAFVYPLFGHSQHYCNHICPLGSAQILMAEICGYKIKMSKKLIQCLNWFRKILWAVLMLLLWADCLSEWMDYELFQAFQFESAPLGIIITALIFILLSSVVARPYCRFVCPIGSLFKFAENMD